MNNLIKRTITGTIFVCIIVCAILYSPYSFITLVLLISLFSLVEFYQLLRKHATYGDHTLINTLGGVYLVASTFIYSSGLYQNNKIFVPYLVYLLFAFISQLYIKNEDPIKNWAYSFLGQIYIALPFSLLNIIAFQSTPNNVSGYHSILPLSFFVFIWINDTGAYLVGSMLGKRRLFERISPKKSWEGFFGGFGFSLATGFIFASFSNSLNLYQWLSLAAVISIFSVWGDLSESLLKRTIQIKDSGSILPGHGGMLDRFDSVFLASPAMIILLKLFFD